MSRDTAFAQIQDLLRRGNPREARKIFDIAIEVRGQEVAAVELATKHSRGEAAQSWTQTAEQMPPDATYVLAYEQRTGIIACGMAMKRDDGVMWMFNGTVGHESKFPHLKFTHWMPLPARPSRGTSNRSEKP